MATQYISCADTAKLIRQALKEAFPDVKFGVRSSVYSGGASINVRWTDGPNTRQVEAVAKIFEGGYFDGMTDYQGSCYSMIDGKVTSFGADFVFCNRSYSDEFIARAIAAVAAEYAGNLKAEGAVIPTVDDYRNGRTFSMAMPGMSGNYWGWGELINRRLSKVSDRIAVEKSKTAGKVIYLGNDGYSDVGALSQEVAA
jgi:hypothetical protein